MAAWLRALFATIVVCILLLPPMTAQKLDDSREHSEGVLSRSLLSTSLLPSSLLYILIRFLTPVDSICITQSFGIADLLLAIFRGIRFSLPIPAATLLTSQLMMVGAAAQYPGATCVPLGNVLQYNGGIFTPLPVLPSVVATTSWQVSVWRASSSALLQLSATNGLSRPLTILGTSPVTTLSGVLPLFLLGPPQPFLFPLESRDNFNLTSDMLPIVDAYLTSIASTQSPGLKSAVLLLDSIDDSDGLDYWSVAYVLYQAVGNGVKPTSLHYFEASFYKDASASRARAARVGGRRLAAHMEGGGQRRQLQETADRSSSGACESYACRSCSPAPPGCRRGASSWPGCSSCCTCA